MLFSYHNHSNYSDGSSTIDEIIKEAIKLNLDEVGISDHFHLPKKNDALFSCDMEIDKLDNYVKEVLSYKNLKKPKVKLALEVEFIEETLDDLKKIINNYPFDYLIGSVHSITNDIHLDQRDYFSFEILEKYWKKVKSLAESKFFNIMGHIDIYKKHGFKTKDNLDSLINEALNAIKEADMSIELNTSGFFYKCTEQYPGIEILKKIKEKDISVLINADAHNPKNLIREFTKAKEILKSLGFEKIATYTNRKKILVFF
jgi:histidinol-phosphatase (PHP family)